jgi:hypothetical protein
MTASHALSHLSYSPKPLVRGHQEYRSHRRLSRAAQVALLLPAPSVCCAESPRSKTVMQAQDVSCDGNKKVKGRTRPIVVDTLGLLVEVVTKIAKTDDRQERVVLLQRSYASGTSAYAR